MIVHENDDAELLQAFLEEAREHLDGIEGDLIQLESSAQVDDDLVNKVFRAVHSVKGAAGFFGLDCIKNLSHAMENVLSPLKKGLITPNSVIVGALLQAADALVEMIHAPERSNEYDISAHLQALQSAIGAPAATHNAPLPQNVIINPATQGAHAAPKAEPAPAEAAPSEAADAPTALEIERPGSVPPAAASKAKDTATAQTPSTDSSIRVHLETLDRLMTLAGELVLTRNQLLQSHDSGAGTNSEATQRIDHITTELQDAIMSTRMQSVGLVFQRFRRIVRDLAKSLGKEVELVIEGEEVELDRTIVEAIMDPLTHLVRNSLDHGIESPAVRQTRGKPSRGTLRLSAIHKAGQVIIEIADDGGGINPSKIREKALEKGICTREQLASMSEAAVMRLIFRPGFSTAAQVTDVSGRGVGMDVVQSNLTRLGGTVDVQSTVGEGTLMRIKLPLTLAIIPCLLISEEGESFAIPQSNLVELHRLPASDVAQRIKKFGDALVLRLRGELIPLVRLRDVLNIPTRTYKAEREERDDDKRDTGYDRRQDESDTELNRRHARDRRHSHHSAVPIAIVIAGDFRFGIMVENLQDSLEIVVKPLGRHLRHCDSYAGATILGDGSLALILDVVSIGRRLQAAENEKNAASAKQIMQKAADATDQVTLMLVENSGDELMAIPLGLIERIERIKASEIQHVAGRRTLVYRGRNLPLLGIDEVVQVRPCRDQSTLYAVVFRSHDRELGLLVSDLVDVVDSSATVDELTHRQVGVFGSLLIDGKVVLLLDIQRIAHERLGQPETTKGESTNRPTTVLVVEDSRFFRDRISEFAKEAGYEVLLAEDGVQGYESLMAHAQEVDLIVTDIEMPNMDGFEFTRKVRADARFADLPIVAVTSLMGEQAEERGKAVGITEYLIKLDRERLIERVGHYIHLGRVRQARSAA
jgi:two-component system chemotaxis sensor kinase CheA